MEAVLAILLGFLATMGRAQPGGLPVCPLNYLGQYYVLESEIRFDGANDACAYYGWGVANVTSEVAPYIYNIALQCFNPPVISFFFYALDNSQPAYGCSLFENDWRQVTTRNETCQLSTFPVICQVRPILTSTTSLSSLYLSTTTVRTQTTQTSIVTTIVSTQTIKQTQTVTITQSKHPQAYERKPKNGGGKVDAQQPSEAGDTYQLCFYGVQNTVYIVTDTDYVPEGATNLTAACAAVGMFPAFLNQSLALELGSVALGLCNVSQVQFGGYYDTRYVCGYVDGPLDAVKVILEADGLAYSACQTINGFACQQSPDQSYNYTSSIYYSSTTTQTTMLTTLSQTSTVTLVRTVSYTTTTPLTASTTTTTTTYTTTTSQRTSPEDCRACDHCDHYGRCP
jgi:hypothetical protein